MTSSTQLRKKADDLTAGSQQGEGVQVHVDASGSLAEPAPRWDRKSTRWRLYVGVLLLAYVLAWGAGLSKAYLINNGRIDFFPTDAGGYYAYLPSLMLDGDLDFTNQQQHQFGSDTPGWFMGVNSDGRNRYPIGMAVSLVPSFAVAHGVSLVLHGLTGSAWFSPTGYTLVYNALNLALMMGYGLMGLMLMDDLMTRRYALRGGVVAAAVLTFWLGTNYVWYYVREPFMSHVVGGFFVIASVYVLDRVLEAIRERDLAWWHLPLLTFVVAMAGLSRLTNVFVWPMVAYLVVQLVRQRLWGQTLKSLPLMVVAALPMLLQIVIWRQSAGVTVHTNLESVGYRSDEVFNWTSPALIETLISSRHGLFFWSPIYLFSAWGILWYVVRRQGYRDALLGCMLLGFLTLWYINSSWYAWWFGPAVGGRAFLELAGLFVFGFAFAYEQLRTQRRSVRRLVVGLLMLAALVNAGLIGMRLLNLIDHQDYLLTWWI